MSFRKRANISNQRQFERMIDPAVVNRIQKRNHIKNRKRLIVILDQRRKKLESACERCDAFRENAGGKLIPIDDKIHVRISENQEFMFGNITIFQGLVPIA